MDNQEAKFILKAYRPGGADADNAVFCAALAQAERDPELRAWFEREQARDNVVAAKLKAVPIPAGLRESILAGGKMSTTHRSWWQQPTWLALAASVVILVSVAVTWQSRARAARLDLNQLTAQILDDAAHGERHGSHGQSANQLVSFLSQPTSKLALPFPLDLGRLKSDGCRTLTVAGHEVLEVCFERNGGEFHLYVMARPSSRGLPKDPQFTAQNGIHSVMWTGDHHLYVMASAKDETALRALL
jgi:hypothetical protein